MGLSGGWEVNCFLPLSLAHEEMMETGEEVGVASEIEYLIKWKGKSYLHSSWHTGSVWARSQALPLAIMTGSEAGECVFNAKLYSSICALKLHLIL